MRVKKQTNNLLVEALGVPDDIKMLVEIYGDLIIDKLIQNIGFKNYKLSDINIPNYGEYESLHGKFNITGSESWKFLTNSPKWDKNKWKIFPMYKNSFEINFRVLPSEYFEINDRESPGVGASFIFEPGKMSIKTTKSGMEYYDSSNFMFDIHMNEEQFSNPISIKRRLEAVISHEIFHSYQLFTKYKKTKQVGYGTDSVLNSMQGLLMSEFNKDWNDFLLCVYYTLKFEQQARVPQVYYNLKDKQITNYEQFVSALKNEDVYKEIEMLKKFNSDKILEDMTKINSFQDVIMAPIKIQQMIENIKNWDDFMEIVLDKLQQMGQDIGSIKRLGPKVLGSPESFFKYWEKLFHYRADQMWRKLTRLYDKIKD
jgi:hypothetical protein